MYSLVIEVSILTYISISTCACCIQSCRNDMYIPLHVIRCVPYAHTYTLVSVKLCYLYYKMLFICVLLPICYHWQYMDFVLYCVLYC